MTKFGIAQISPAVKPAPPPPPSEATASRFEKKTGPNNIIILVGLPGGSTDSGAAVQNDVLVSSPLAAPFTNLSSSIAIPALDEHGVVMLCGFAARLVAFFVPWCGVQDAVVVALLPMNVAIPPFRHPGVP